MKKKISAFLASMLLLGSIGGAAMAVVLQLSGKKEANS